MLLTLPQSVGGVGEGPRAKDKRISRGTPAPKGSAPLGGGDQSTTKLASQIAAMLRDPAPCGLELDTSVSSTQQVYALSRPRPSAAEGASMDHPQDARMKGDASASSDLFLPPYWDSPSSRTPVDKRPLSTEKILPRRDTALDTAACRPRPLDAAAKGCARKDTALARIQWQVNAVLTNRRPATLGHFGCLVECSCRALGCAARPRRPPFRPPEKVGVLRGQSPKNTPNERTASMLISGTQNEGQLEGRLARRRRRGSFLESPEGRR